MIKSLWPVLVVAGCMPAAPVRWLREDVHPVAVHGDRRLDHVKIWIHGQMLEWGDVLVTRDSISGVPYGRAEQSDSSRRALPTALVDSLKVGYSTIAKGDSHADTWWVQDAPADGQFAGTIGLAAGSGTITCTSCTHAGTMGGPTATLQVAGRVNAHLGIAGTSDWWSHSEDDWARGVWSINALLLFYSGSARRGFFIGGGPSYSQMVAWMTDTTGLQRHGWGITTEMGYDIRVRQTTSLTPFVEYTTATVGDIYYPLHSTIPWARGWKHRVLSVGLGLTFHQRRRE